MYDMMRFMHIALLICCIVYLSFFKKKSIAIYILSIALLLLSISQFIMNNILREQMLEVKIMEIIEDTICKITILNIVAPIVMLSITILLMYKGTKGKKQKTM
ncbi:MAG: hypothetical protein WDA65_03670 [Christensenellales bacterium]